MAMETKKNLIYLKACLRNIALMVQVIIVALIAIMPVRPVVAEDFSHPGYLSDVTDERYQVSREVVIVPPAEALLALPPPLILTEKMSKEFIHEFRYRFGFTEFEQLAFTSNRFVSGGENGRLMPVDEFIDKQHSFGKYMMRELMEYHVDSYLKGHRNTRVVYEVKEAISNVEVKAAGSYKLKFRYKISSNRLVVKLEKPNETFHQQLDANLDGTAATVRLGYDVSKTVRVNTDYSIADEIISLRGEKRLTASLVTSVTGQSFQKALGSDPKQERILLGLGWND